MEEWKSNCNFYISFLFLAFCRREVAALDVPSLRFLVWNGFELFNFFFID